ncbi:hypothetical protein CVT26_003136, partial [Gymnopilus dilepis]
MPETTHEVIRKGPSRKEKELGFKTIITFLKAIQRSPVQTAADKERVKPEHKDHLRNSNALVEILNTNNQTIAERVKPEHKDHLRNSNALVEILNTNNQTIAVADYLDETGVNLMVVQDSTNDSDILPSDRHVTPDSPSANPKSQSSKLGVIIQPFLKVWRLIVTINSSAVRTERVESPTNSEAGEAAAASFYEDARRPAGVVSHRVQDLAGYISTMTWQVESSQFTSTSSSAPSWPEHVWMVQALLSQVHKSPEDNAGNSEPKIASILKMSGQKRLAHYITLSCLRKLSERLENREIRFCMTALVDSKSKVDVLALEEGQFVHLPEPSPEERIYNTALFDIFTRPGGLGKEFRVFDNVK